MADTRNVRERAVREAIADARPGATVSQIRRLGGGASKENWHASLEQDGGRQSVVIRIEPLEWRFAQSDTIPLCSEAHLLRCAAAADIPVPKVLFELEHEVSGYVMEHIAGETIGSRILKTDKLASARVGLARACGSTLAAIHQLEHDSLPALACRSASEGISVLERQLRVTGQDRPVFELALAWLARNAPSEEQRTLVHGDFRNGNLIVGEEGLRAVLDWETAHLGCPAEDLGWMCVTSWRFQNPQLPVGGFGTREELLAGYTEGGGRRVPLTELRYWEVYGTLRWGIMCAQVGKSFLDGTRSVESAIIARRASETEFDLLRLISSDGDADAR